MRQWLNFNFKKYISDKRFKSSFKIDETMKKSKSQTFKKIRL